MARPIEDCCNAETIDSYLSDGLGESERATLEDHLSTCDTCRDLLHHMAAEPEEWNSARTLLGDAAADSVADEVNATDAFQPGMSVLDSLAPTDDPEMLGRLGEYEISGVVGIGGMGVVLRGFDNSLRRVVAIKVMAPHLAGSGPARSRFQREARAAAAITHDNVIDIYGVAEASGLPYLVMPFARGPSLQRRIDRSGPLSAIEVVRIGRQIASGLGAAHEQGLVHRDIKPANILLNEGIERLWITDFGVARAMDDVSMTNTGIIAGTPQYMSPEQARGETVDQRSDLFSLGSILYTACTGRAPFRSEAAYGVLRRITDTDPRPIREINADIPDWLCRIIDRLMAKHPGDRFQTAQEVADLLEGCLAHLQQPTHVDLPGSISGPFVSTADSNTERTAGRASVSSAATTYASASNRSPISFLNFSTIGFWIMSSLLVLAAATTGLVLFTEPSDISGDWAGENWTSVTLTTVAEADGWYTGTFVDADGRAGAIQLEWSRIQRRFNGRWKVAGDVAGALTVRPNNGSLRGAITVDADSALPANVPRLREFAWQPSESRRIDPRASAVINQREDKALEIRAITTGNLIRLAPGIEVGAYVQEGQLIAELADENPERTSALEMQKQATIRALDSSVDKYKTLEGLLSSAQESLHTHQSQVDVLQQARDQKAMASEYQLDSVANKIDAAKAEREAMQAAYEKSQNDLKVAETVSKKGLVSQQEVSSRQQQVAVAKAKLDQADAKVAELEDELKVRKSQDRAAALSSAMVEINNAIIRLKEAEENVLRIELEIRTAQDEIDESKTALQDLDIKLSQLLKVKFSAPLAGEIVRLSQAKQFRAGDVICVLRPRPVRDETTAQPATDATESGERLSAPQIAIAGESGASILSRLPEWSLARSLEQAILLGNRRRELTLALDDSGAAALSKEAAEQYKTQLDEIERQRTVALDIHKAQLDAAQELCDDQTKLFEVAQQGFDAGAFPMTTYIEAEQALKQTQFELQQLAHLVEYHTDLKEGHHDRRAVNEIAKKILQVQLEAVSNRIEFLEKQSEMYQHAFQQGNSDIDTIIRIRQQQSQASTDLRMVQAVLEYYADTETEQEQQ